MDATILEEIGLTTTQAKAYLALVQYGTLSPPALADKIGESRTNAYMVLDKLVELGLAQKTNTKKLQYRPENPRALENLLEQKQKKIQQTVSHLQESIPQMLEYFNSRREQPSVKVYQGKRGLIQIYEDHLRSRKDSYYLRTVADHKGVGKDIIEKYLFKRAKLGIKAVGIAPDVAPALKWDKQHDKQLNREVTYLPAKDYTAPVEIATYGNRTTFISFGQEAIGVAIDSPQIAEAMRQAFAIMKVGAKELSEQKAKK